MFKSDTDYSAFPTLAVLSDNDRKKLYRRPLSEKDILVKFEEIQEIKTLLISYIKENESLQSKVNILENKVKQLEKQSLSPGQSYTMGSYGGEKIQWKVLKVEGGKALLLSEKGLDSRPYHKVVKGITWEKSDLRQWLNQEFVNQAFSAGEKQKLATTQVKNPDNPGFGTNGGNTTRDQVFLLSIDEAKEYFKTDEERICYPTGYTKKQGVYVDDSSGSCWWWLRSPGHSRNYAALVFNDGEVFANGNFVNYASFGVRPALWINL